MYVTGRRLDSAECRKPVSNGAKQAVSHAAGGAFPSGPEARARSGSAATGGGGSAEAAGRAPNSCALAVHDTHRPPTHPPPCSAAHATYKRGAARADGRTCKRDAPVPVQPLCSEAGEWTPGQVEA